MHLVRYDAAEQHPKPEQEKMFDLIRQQEESDMNVRQFCALHNLPASRYYYWRKKYYEKIKKNAGPGFSLLQPDHNLSAGTPFCELTTAAGTSIRFYKPVLASTLQLLMSSLSDYPKVLIIRLKDKLGQ